MPKEFHQLDWDAAVEDDLRQLVRLAVREDLERQNDWTTIALVDSGQQGRAAIVAREEGVIAGIHAAPVLIDEMQTATDVHACTSDGDAVAAGTAVAELSGAARDLLTCERTLLNLLGRLSGIATLTRQYVERIADTGARIYDTRKTTPGWRRLEKYAVRCGGGTNHRTGLFDAILIKDNHLALAAAAGLSPADAVRRACEFVEQAVASGLLSVAAHEFLIEVEVDRLEQLDDVLGAGPDIVLLDNFSLDDLRQAVARRIVVAPHVELEASGGVTLETVRDIALTGVERISVGALTHAARSLDLALDWHAAGNGPLA